ncbi:LOW QUALITY PROTEIN: hypothetical protein RJ639_002623 [Escallonia herrerae]|uniref:Heat shock protein 70 n=1 Tax=Escallonia herrerae TaxID=1293975 RepID=A0AA88XR46_9ASTE|nr:LOW QUALITY PROTEIN: hypothetical protein RJ639_002623 [Escallonia herrerae]
MEHTRYLEPFGRGTAISLTAEMKAQYRHHLASYGNTCTLAYQHETAGYVNNHRGEVITTALGREQGVRNSVAQKNTAVAATLRTAISPTPSRLWRKMSEVDEKVSYTVVHDENGNVKLDCPIIGKQFAVEEIPAQVLRKLVDDASKFLNDKVTKAVVTVPAYFNDSQMTATKDAGRIARLEVLRIINEPTTASLAYVFERKNNEIILVFDLGGGTFDVSATAGGPKHIDTTLTRAKFEELCSDLLDRLKTPVENSLRDAKLSFKDLDEVILVGGSTRIPAVQGLKLTGKEPNVTVNPDEVVALGAAVQQNCGDKRLAFATRNDVYMVLVKPHEMPGDQCIFLWTSLQPPKC